MSAFLSWSSHATAITLLLVLRVLCYIYWYLCPSLSNDFLRLETVTHSSLYRQGLSAFSDWHIVRTQQIPLSQWMKECVKFLSLFYKMNSFFRKKVFSLVIITMRESTDDYLLPVLLTSIIP